MHGYWVCAAANDGMGDSFAKFSAKICGLTNNRFFDRKYISTENNKLFSTPLANDKPMDAKILYICMIVSFFLGFIVSNIV